jgi:hypothetical protein
MEIFEREPGNTVPFNEFLDGRRRHGIGRHGQDDHSKNLLVAIMLNMFYENMLRTPKRPYALGQIPSSESSMLICLSTKLTTSCGTSSTCYANCCFKEGSSVPA